MNARTMELHLLQSFPPSCVNRDGNNSPKDCTFGGARRARISSQCLKRAVRQAESFAQTVNGAVAVRSKQMRDKKLIPYLLEQGLAQKEAEKVADDFRRALATDDKKSKEKQTSVGLYFGDEELFALLDAFRNRDKDKDWKKKGGPKSADVALFGRMLAVATDLSSDAAAQVAHAISTHKLSQEMDYWTAVDDLKDRSDGEDAGAGMLGTAEFNASVFYRYACINLEQLGRNRHELSDNNGQREWSRGRELTLSTVKAFLLASFEAIPTGKLNGHAHFTPPFLALAVVRQKGMPLNLCNAFLEPVRATNGRSLASASAEAMLDHLHRMRAMVPVDQARYVLAHGLRDEPSANNVDRVAGYAALVDKVMEALQ